MPAPTWQPDLFKPMCAKSVADQGTLFGTDDDRDRPRPCPACDCLTTKEVCPVCGHAIPAPGRHRDLPGQTYLEM